MKYTSKALDTTPSLAILHTVTKADLQDSCHMNWQTLSVQWHNLNIKFFALDVYSNDIPTGRTHAM